MTFFLNQKLGCFKMADSDLAGSGLDNTKTKQSLFKFPYSNGALILLRTVKQRFSRLTSQTIMLK